MNIREIKEGDIIGVTSEMMGGTCLIIAMKCSECGELVAAPQQEGMPIIKTVDYIQNIAKFKCQWCAHSDDACDDPGCRIHLAKKGIAPPPKEKPVDARRN